MKDWPDDLQSDVRRFLLGRSAAGQLLFHRMGEEEGSRYGEEAILMKTSPVEETTEFLNKKQEDLEKTENLSCLPESLAGEEEGVDARWEAEVKKMDLKELEEAVSSCRRCELCRTRTKTVFGDGNRRANVIFVGEAPGRDEDLQGIPFVGRAGKLLDKILAAIGFTREDIFIANILKCRPPNNRDPEEKEVIACEHYLARQIELIDPVLICALGRVAAQNLLKTKDSLGRLREGTHYYNDRRLLVTYHPAALLRNPAYKRPTWEDMKLLRRLYDEGSEGTD